jgi:hypothetical protein
MKLAEILEKRKNKCHGRKQLFYLTPTIALWRKVVPLWTGPKKLVIPQFICHKW